MRRFSREAATELWQILIEQHRQPASASGTNLAMSPMLWDRLAEAQRIVLVEPS